MSIRISNMEAIQNRFPHLLSVIIDDKEIPSVLQVSRARDGRLNIGLDQNGRVAHLYSNYNSEREIALWLDQVTADISDSQQLLVIGLGLGYHIEALMKRFPDKLFFVYEPSPYIFSKAIESIDLFELINNKNIVDIAVGTDRDVINKFLNLYTDKVVGSFTEIIVPTYAKLFGDEIELFHELAVQITKMKRSNLATFSQYSNDWISNILRNLYYISKSSHISIFHNKFDNIPAVVVGSGPSLQYDLELLKEIKNKAIIIAAGTSTQALLANNIEPDIIVSMDGNVANNRAFESIETNHIPMVFGTFIYPEILNDNRKHMAYTIMNLDIVTPHLLSNITEITKFKSNFSVTGLCIQLAAYMGCRSVILTGQDLSFPNRKYYASGVKHADSAVIDQLMNQGTMKVPNVFGTTNDTNHTMFVTLKDIEQLIEQFPDVDFTNASQHGAVIKGAPFRTLGELLINELDTQDENFVKRLFDSNTQQNIVSDLICRLERDQYDLHSLKLSLQQLLKLIDRMTKKINNMNELINGLNQIAEQWGRISANKVYQIYVSFGLNSMMNSYQRYISQISSLSNPRDKFRIIEKYLKLLIKHILEFIPFLESEFSSSIHRLKSDC